MSFYEVANHPLIYVLVTAGVLYVSALCIVSMRKSWKRAKVKGYTHDKLMQIVKISISATVVPALAIVISLLALSTILGIPWPWWRLSVVGSVTYETMAADMAVKSVGKSLSQLTDAGAKEFVLVMFVMSIGIIGGLFFSPFVSKKIQLGTMNIKSGDKRWGVLASSVFFPVILLVFIVPVFLNFTKTGIVTILVFFTSALCAVIINTIAEKGKIPALKQFTLALSMVIAMVSSVLWSGIINN